MGRFASRRLNFGFPSLVYEFVVPKCGQHSGLDSDTRATSVPMDFHYGGEPRDTSVTLTFFLYHAVILIPPAAPMIFLCRPEKADYQRVPLINCGWIGHCY
jgi:hypothetical protein